MQGGSFHFHLNKYLQEREREREVHIVLMVDNFRREIHYNFAFFFVRSNPCTETFRKFTYVGSIFDSFPTVARCLEAKSINILNPLFSRVCLVWENDVQERKGGSRGQKFVAGNWCESGLNLARQAISVPRRWRGNDWWGSGLKIHFPAVSYKMDNCKLREQRMVGTMKRQYQASISV